VMSGEWRAMSQAEKNARIRGEARQSGG